VPGSAEGAHGEVLERLGLKPVLSLDMRLGEASGAALALGLLKGALACHRDMATFEQAGVSGKSAVDTLPAMTLAAEKAPAEAASARRARAA
jgi:NaMN:DMB phosphoribosyltransferase